MPINDALIIIRSVNERTIDKCIESISNQGVDRENILVINEVPFSKALFESYNQGIKRNKQWTLCVDGDLLLKSGSILAMLNYISATHESIFEVQGFVYDKFFGGPRVGGIHLYRTSLLPKALDFVSAQERTIRPEASTLRYMEAKGHKYLVIPYVVGVHDYEQYFKDIYRKCFVYGKKHRAYYEMFLNRWSRLSATDEDFEVALHGLKSGYEFTGEVISSVNTPDVGTDYKLPKEKSTEITMTQSDVDLLCDDNTGDVDFADYFPVPFINIKYENKYKTQFSQILTVLNQLGMYRGFKFLTSIFFNKFKK